MTVTVWKYGLLDNHTEDEENDILFAAIDMPAGSKILKVALQNGSPQLWALVDTKQKKVHRRKFVIAGTGKKIPVTFPENLNYIDTFEKHKGSFIFHVFELPLEIEEVKS